MKSPNRKDLVKLTILNGGALTSNNIKEKTKARMKEDYGVNHLYEWLSMLYDNDNEIFSVKAKSISVRETDVTIYIMDTCYISGIVDFGWRFYKPEFIKFIKKVTNDIKVNYEL